MPLIPSTFLAGSLLSLLLPVLLLIALVVWYVIAVQRVPTGFRRSDQMGSGAETRSGAGEVEAPAATEPRG